MCLGGRRSPPPAQQSGDQPYKSPGAGNTSTTTTEKPDQKTVEFGDPNKTNPKAYEDTFMGHMTNIHRQAKFKGDQGINL